MNIPTLRRPLLVLAGFLTLTLSGLAAAEPPSRAARLGYISGAVSFSPAGQPDWVQAVVNRPLTTGDRLWADADSRAELQIGGASIRLGANTSVTLLNLDDRITQVQLAEGTLKVRVRQIAQGQTLEVNTPNLAISLRRPGEYRIDVDPNDDATAVMVQSGEAEVYGEGASYAVNPRQGYRFYGTDLSDYEPLARRNDDDLDRWARDRDRRGDNSPSARFVSPEVVGYEDLDANGSWRADPNYGNVWMPTRVAAGWTPYRDGHWAWVDPWGWTWVDDAPWGFAVSHYGRWANIGGSWGWVPGPPRERAVYAPALVAFVGGNNFQLSLSVGNGAAVGWFPLAPREVYRPSYPVSRGYFDNINRSNAVIAPTTITNVYNTTVVNNNTTTVVNNTTNVSKVVYVNQQVTGAVVAVPAQAFVRSQPVAKATMPLSREAAISAPVAHLASVAPVAQSVHGDAPDAAAKPPARERAVVARTAPPPPPVPFAAQQKQLAAEPGRPIDEVQRTQLKAAVPVASVPKASVLTTAQAPTPTAFPPATPAAGKSPDARRADRAKAAGATREPSDGDTRQADDAKAAAHRADAAKAEAAAPSAEPNRADAAKADATRAATARAQASKAEAAQADAAKTATAKTQASRAESARADAANAEAARATTARADASRVEVAKAQAANAAIAEAEASKAEAAQAEAAKADAAKAATAKNEHSRAESTRADAAKAEAARATTARAEASKAEAVKVDAARARTARAEGSRADAAKAEATRADAAKAAAARAEASRAAEAKAEVTRSAAVKPGTAAPPSSGRAPAANPEHDARAKEEEEKKKKKKKKAEEDERKR